MLKSLHRGALDVVVGFGHTGFSGRLPFTLPIPAATTFFVAFNAIIAISDAALTVTVFGADLSRLTPPIDRQIGGLLAEAGGLASLFLRTDPSPWTGAVLPDGPAVQRALDLVQQMHAETLPNFLKSVEGVVAQAGLRQPGTIQQASDRADLLGAVQTTLSFYSPEIHLGDPESLLRGLAPGRAGGFSPVWAWCTNGSYRKVLPPGI